MKFPSPSLEVDGRADAAAVHTRAGNLEAMKHTSSSHCAKERLSRSKCFTRADSVILDHSTALRSKCFKEGENRYEPMRNVDL